MLKDNFQIKHNLIIKTKSIVAVYQLEPVDVIILPEVEQQTFMQDMQHFLASIQEGHVQILMRTRKAIPHDFAGHFASLQNSSVITNFRRNDRQVLVSQYIEQLSELLDRNIIPVKEYYLVFEQDTRDTSPEALYNGVQSLERNISRIAGNIAKAGIGIKQVAGNDLNKFMITFTRTN